MKVSEKRKKSLKRSARIASHGVAGSIVGTTVGYHFGHQRLGYHIGAGVGTAVGSFREHRKAVQTQSEATGGDKFQSVVGTKTNGRVGKKDHPYHVRGGK